MTPKQKAKELVNKFTRIEDDTVFYWEPYYDTMYSDDEILPHAKKCAKTVCNEILTELNKKPSKDLSDLQYWTEIEHEISLL